MKILIISKDFPNIVGGVSDYTYHLSKNLSKKKIDVYVLTSCSEKVIREIKGYNVKILPLIKKWGFSSISEIINEIQKVNPEFILLQYTPYMYSYYGIPFWLIFLYFKLKFKRFKICTNFHEISILINLGDFKHLGIAMRGGISTKSGSLAAAYAAGLPIIGTKGDMTDDFFKNLENIFLIEKLEVDEIVNAIKKIIDKELYNRLKYFSKKTYEEKLSWEVISEKYKNLILNG